jgi:hypothetical protein
MTKSWKLGALGVGAVAVAVAVVVAVMATSAGAVTGTPATTISSSFSGGLITVSGTYSDPSGVCVISGRPVTVTLKRSDNNNDVGGSPLSTTTAANGTWSVTSNNAIPTNKTINITATVTGALSGGYGAGDVCPNATNSTTQAT